MAATKYEQSAPLIKDVIQTFDQLNGGVHTGYRPAHAKGILLSGVFTPSAGGSALTRAPHLHAQSTPVTVRFSDFAGVPTVPDNDPNASPRGFAVRFHLGEHVHTDIIGHSVDGFPSRTPEEFAEFLKAAGASGPGASKPTPVEVFLGSHPAALAFVMAPKPFPTSFARESFFSVNAYRFVSQSGVIQFGRYRIRPDGDGEYLNAAGAAAKSANYLFDEIKERLAKGPVKLHIFVQLAAPGDVVDDCTIHWPENRPQTEFGTLALSSLHPDSDATQRQIIFDPIPRVDGIEASEDPLLEARAAVYLATGRRRRAGSGQ